MRPSSAVRAGLRAFILAFIFTSVAAHSWIEVAYKIDAASRKFFGAPGYPRGGSFRRLSAENGLTDQEYIHRIPEDGKYTGQENINKRPIEANRPDETLEAAPGDYIAIMHLENGHVSYKQDGRPLNSGTIYIYGTDKPKDEDKLFDIHLVWNEDGTGGDGRGRLLATRNYDDGQCYEGNANSEVAMARSKANNATPQDTLACQSNIQLPEDLKPGSTYTIYWYWDWPILNQGSIDMEGTKKGLFPWMGTFMEGHKDPRGFTEAALMTNESYSSTLDVKIVEKSAYSSQPAQNVATGNSPVYNMAIKEQMENQFDVQVPTIEGGGDNSNNGSGEGAPPAPPSTDAAPSATGGTVEAPAPATVTVTETITAPSETQAALPGVMTVTETVTAPGEPQDASPTAPSFKSTSTETVVQVETQFATVYPGDAGGHEARSAQPPQATPCHLKRRRNWAFGGGH